MKKTVEGLFRGTVLFIFGVIILFLLLQSIFSTSVLGSYVYEENGIWKQIGDHTYYIADSFLLQTLALSISGLAGYFIFVRSKKLKYFNQVLTALYVFCGCLFVMKFQLYPRSDQRKLLEVVSQMRLNNFDEFNGGGVFICLPESERYHFNPIWSVLSVRRKSLAGGTGYQRFSDCPQFLLFS